VRLRQFVSGLVLCVLPLSIAPASAGNSPMETKERAVPVATIAMKPWRTRWAIEAQVGGKNGLYLLDTGAGISLISAESAARAGCVPWGRLTGFNMMGERSQGPHCGQAITFGISGVEAWSPLTGIIDMGSVNPRDAELDGIIGLNAFEGRTVTFDFSAGTLIVESEASRIARVATMRPLQIRLKREIDGSALAVMLAVPSSKGPLWFELDSGNGGTVLVSRPVADLVGLDPAAEGRQKADFAILGDIRAKTDDAFTPDMIMDGNLGMPFLRNWVLTFDLARGLAWIGVPEHPAAPALPLEPMKAQ